MSKKSGKVRRRERFRYLVADPAEADRALAEARLAALRARDDDPVEADERVRAAEQARNDCYGVIVVQALTPDEYEAFQQEMVERDEARAAVVKAAEEAEQEPPPEPKSTWDAQSLEVRLIAACDIDPDHTVKWWASEFASGDWAVPERDELLELCYQVNLPRRSFDFGVLGKG